jgi:hypothetical protein
MQSSLLGIDAYDSSDADSEPQQHTEGQPINKADDSEEDVDRPRFGMGMFANHNESVQSAPAVATAPTNPGFYQYFSDSSRFEIISCILIVWSRR